MQKSNGGNSRHHHRKNVHRKFAEVFQRKGRVDRVVRLGDQHVSLPGGQTHQPFDSCLDLIGTPIPAHCDDILIVGELLALRIKRPADQQRSVRETLVHRVAADLQGKRVGAVALGSNRQRLLVLDRDLERLSKNARLDGAQDADRAVRQRRVAGYSDNTALRCFEGPRPSSGAAPRLRGPGHRVRAG